MPCLSYNSAFAPHNSELLVHSLPARCLALPTHHISTPGLASHNEIQDSGAERLACSLGGDTQALKVHGITGYVRAV
jgi:hypothetical protein